MLTDDNSNGTETGALFAGTGSEVRVKPKKVNRFDAIKAAAAEDVKKVPEKIELSLKQKEKMRQLAKKLSQKIGQSKDKKNDSPASDEKVMSSDEAYPNQVNGSWSTEPKMFEESANKKGSHIKEIDEPQPGTSSENGKHKHKHKHKHKKSKKKKPKDICKFIFPLIVYSILLECIKSIFFFKSIMFFVFF